MQQKRTTNNIKTYTAKQKRLERKHTARVVNLLETAVSKAITKYSTTGKFSLAGSKKAIQKQLLGIYTSTYKTFGAQNMLSKQETRFLAGLAKQRAGQIVLDIQNQIKTARTANKNKKSKILAMRGIQNTNLIFRGVNVVGDNISLAANMSLALLSGVQGATHKTWKSVNATNTRASHRHAHNQTVPIADKFQVGHSKMEHPHDLNAPGSEIYNCRCWVLYS